MLSVDADLIMVKRALNATTEAGLENVSIIQADAQHLPAIDSTFDVVTSSAGLSNMDNPSRVLQEANRVLKSKGMICFAEPVHDSKITEIWETLSTFKYGYRRTYPTYHGLMRLLRSNDFIPLLCEPMLWKRPLNEFLKDVTDADGIVSHLLQSAIENLSANTLEEIGIEILNDNTATLTYECVICLAVKETTNHPKD